MKEIEDGPIGLECLHLVFH